MTPADLLCRLFPFLFRPDNRTERRKLGDRGEAAAEVYFKGEGYRVLARNWRHGRDELDLILRTPGEGVLVFVEVKTRDELDPKGGYFAVDARKRKALRRAVRGYLRAIRQPGAAFRFDIAEVKAGDKGSLRVIHHCAVPLFPK